MPLASPQPTSESSIVLISREGALADAIKEVLQAGGLPPNLRMVGTAEEFAAVLADGPDLVLLDADCPACEFGWTVERLTATEGEVPLILISSQHEVERAVEAIKRGAENFIFKDRLARLVPAIWQARQNRDQRREHSRTTRELRANERLLRTTGRIARVGGWSLDLRTNAVQWTEETRRIHEVDADFRPTLESAVGFYAPEARDVIGRAVETSMTDGTPWDFELPLVTAKGRPIWVRAQGEALREDGRIVRLVGAFQEITERKLVEERLAQQAVLIDMAPDAIVLRDLDHRILFWSRGAERLYGWTAAEAVGRDFRDLPGFERAELDEIEKAVRARNSWQGELRRTVEGGEVRVLDGHWTFLHDPRGWPASILSIDTDVTARKKLETQFLRAQRLESLGTLAGGISHDLNNVLAPILMATDLLHQHVQSETALRLLDNIGRSARHGADLVKQVLAFARGVEGARIPVQIRHITREIEDIVANSFPKNITLVVDVPRDLRLVLGDPTQINQVLMNLCVNARDAMPDGGRLTLAAATVELDEQYVGMNAGTAPGSYVVVSVADEGVGMPARVLEHIFEPFFTTKDSGKGTGLGLSTVQAIMRSHGGFVNVYSEPGRGSVFKAYFPVANEPATAHPAAPQPAKAPRGEGELILLVDDENAILNVTRQTLQSFGYRVVTAEDGAAAVGIYAQRSSEISLVFTDMMMPVMDGPALIAALRRINPSVRIIASSGLTSGGGAGKAAKSSVSHFLPKPYSAMTMLCLVREALAG